MKLITSIFVKIIQNRLRELVNWLCNLHCNTERLPKNPKTIYELEHL